MSEAIAATIQTPTVQSHPGASTTGVVSGLIPSLGAHPGGFTGVLADAQGRAATISTPDTQAAGGHFKIDDTAIEPLISAGNLLPEPASLSTQPHSFDASDSSVMLADSATGPGFFLRSGTPHHVANQELPSALGPGPPSTPAMTSLLILPKLDGVTRDASGSSKIPLPASLVLQTEGGVATENAIPMAKSVLDLPRVGPGYGRYLADGFGSLTALNPSSSPELAFNKSAVNTGLPSALSNGMLSQIIVDTPVSEPGGYNSPQYSASPILTTVANAGPSPPDMAQINFSSRQFGPELDQHVMWLARNNVQVAKFRLNPPNLGPLEVRVSMNNTDANVHFVSAHAGVRDALEIAIPRLRESLADVGLSLTNTSVSDYTRDDQGQPQDSWLKMDPALDETEVSDPRATETTVGGGAEGGGMGSTLISVYA